MPELSWWVIGAYVVQLVANAFGFGWIARGIRRDYQEISKDAAAALQLARSIKDVDLLAIRQDHNDLAQAVGIQGEKLNEWAKDHDDLKATIQGAIRDMGTVVEGAIVRAHVTASEAVSKAVWRRRRR